MDIDGDDLQQNIINYMPRLNEFRLYSRLTILLNDQIISGVNYFQEAEKDGLFTCVCEVSLFDEDSFEYECFIRIVQSFPFTKNLTIINREPKNHQQYRKLKNNNPDLLIIQYPHLTYLDLDETHDDNVEQFCVYHIVLIFLSIINF
ncbi:unnamed protein product [Rotaria sp. Silwood1]|nr:unnamed protein product [Rotaria sp. Silwood1]